MVDDLYYGHACACCTDIQDANLNISFDDDMLAEVLEEIYNEKVKPAEGEIPRKYFEANRDKFEEATAKGMAQSQNPNIADDKEFLKKYRHSIDVFSAFRSHAYAKRLADELYDSEGKLRPFEEWRKATESIQSHFNRSWLQTEYNTAVLRAEQAADWRHFEDNKEDFPCLKWMPTSSATPREQHKAFWGMGLTLPVADKFWDKHHPGDLWNCKCYLEPTTAEPTPKKRIPKEKDAPKPAKGLESNPGKKAEMFGQNHPYFPKSCTKCPFHKNKQSIDDFMFRKIKNSTDDTPICTECPFADGCNSVIKKYAEKKSRDKNMVFSKEEWKERKDFLRNLKDENKINEWANKELMPTKDSSGNPTKQIIITTKDSYQVIVRPHIFTEALGKCTPKDIQETFKIICEVKNWLKDAELVAVESGDHHNYPFNVYHVIYKGKEIVAKSKPTDGNILYCVRILD